VTEAVVRKRVSRGLAALRTRIGGRRPGRRALVAAVAAAAIIAALVLVTSGMLSRDRPGPATHSRVDVRLLGEYQRGGVAFILDTRRYTLLIPGKEPVVGDAATRGSTLELGNDGAGACAPSGATARYRVLRGSELRLTRVSDDCPARAAALDAAPLRRP
jgi:hypothetical protein